MRLGWEESSQQWVGFRVWEWQYAQMRNVFHQHKIPRPDGRAVPKQVKPACLKGELSWQSLSGKDAVRPLHRSVCSTYYWLSMVYVVIYVSPSIYVNTPEPKIFQVFPEIPNPQEFPSQTVPKRWESNRESNRCRRGFGAHEFILRPISEGRRSLRRLRRRLR